MLECLVDGILHGQAVLFSENVDAPVFDELIGPTDTFHRRFQPGIIQVLDNRASESILDRMIFESHHERALGGKFFEAGLVERFDPARVDQGH